MEIQGLTDTKNTQYQHGASLNPTFSQQTTASGILARPRLIGKAISDLSGSLDIESDDNNNRARSTPLRVAENGSGCLLSLQNSPHKAYEVQSGDAELGDLNVSKPKVFNELELLPSEFERADEHEDNDLQMALPLLDAENCEQRQATEKIPEDTSASSSRSPEELYVVFNIVHKDKERQTSVQYKAEENGSSASPKSKTLDSPTDSEGSFNRTSSKSAHLSSHNNLNVRSERTDQNARQEVCLVTENRNPVLSEDFAGTCQTPNISTGEMLSSSLAEHSTEELMQCVVKNNRLSTDMNEINIMDYANQESSSNGDCGPDGGSIPVHETFSGTIMINNQNIIVTIENGILTLATPPDSYAYKDDGVMSLKEHLGMKDNEDLVLLNYDGGSKSIGKISNVTSSLQDEPKARFANSDSELTLADDCSLSEMGVTLDSCPSIKQEEGSVCAVEDDSSICQNLKRKPLTCEELQPMNLLTVSGMTKKVSLAKYRCPQPGCSSTFDTRQNLKIHLVVHTEDQRPFKCTVEGCDWSFTTSYKLKRHLQSHDKVRPYKCEWENCGRRFTTVYNLKAHVRTHDQENAFVCEVCSERFRTATRLSNHQRTHFEPERPHKCEFPGCEKTFITFSALFSHNRTHFREMAQFTCTYPGCDKRYDKACRLKIHLRSHTGERPFVCDSDSCGWTFTSMSKLLRHKRKHDDDRRFACLEEGCGKSFTRAEHLKGHSITHLGTKPFECPVEGCNAKFSARSSLYIHSKKHKQDGVSLRSRCPVAGCTKHFSSRSSLKTHMLKHHNLSPDVLSQLDDAATLTPSSELTSTSQAVSVPSGPAGAELSSLDLSSLFSSIPACTGPTAVSVGSEGSSGPGSFSMDIPLVNTGILTIDPASVGSALTGTKTVDPLILAAGQDIGVHVLDTGLGTGGGGGVLPHAALHLDDVQTVNPEELGTLTALSIQRTPSSEQLHTMNSCNPLTVESPSALTPSLSSSLTQSLSSLTSTLPPTLSCSLVPSLATPLTSVMSLAAAPVQELLSPQVKADLTGSETSVGPLLSRVEVMPQSDGSKGMCQFVFPSHSGSYSGPKITEIPSVTPCPVMESSGSARTDYRAIQLAKRRKQKGSNSSTCASETPQRKTKVSKSTNSALPTNSSAHFGEGAAAGNGELPIRDPVTGTQFVQIQLLQDDPAADGDLAFQLSSQTSCSHSQLTVDLPVHILQEPTVLAEDESGSDNSQFTGSTINLQDLE
ncbi:zinc finger protein ZXDC [Danio rerio]|uniref:Zinc finger protein ZXDC n=1 Tax=Danio rerio TaxID=7955 RepID=A0ACD6B6W7_DANRE|nr:zinc finger protein ZXDC [Danio rerio]|eukprot:XP_002662446.2 zinc finger protein ZXDC [Danio rerio]